MSNQDNIDPQIYMNRTSFIFANTIHFQILRPLFHVTPYNYIPAGSVRRKRFFILLAILLPDFHIPWFGGPSRWYRLVLNYPLLRADALHNAVYWNANRASQRPNRRCISSTKVKDRFLEKLLPRYRFPTSRKRGGHGPITGTRSRRDAREFSSGFPRIFHTR